MNKSMLFMVNPNAGRGEIRNQMIPVIDTFTVAGYDVTVHPTRRPKEITEYILENGERFDRIVSCGGDGTLNETIAGVMQLRKKPELGFLPEGTTNDFATTLNIPKNLVKAAEVAATGELFPCDVGYFNDRYYTYVAAFGAFTSVCYDTPQADKNALGRAAYILAGIRALGEVRSYHVKVTHDGEIFEDDVILGMVLNATNVGGFKLKGDPNIRLDDGLSELMLIRNVTTLAEFNAMINAVLRQDFSSDYFHFFKTNLIEFTFDEPVPWTLDGEFGGKVTNARIENLHQQLDFIVPSAEQGKGNR